MGMGHFYALIGVALAILLSGVGSAISVGRAGQAASALMSKDPSKFGNAMVLQLLPSSQGLYGFVVAFIMLVKLNILGGPVNDVTVQQGIALLCLCLPIAVVGFVSAIAQGAVVVSGINLLGKQEKQVGHAILFAVMVEIFAIFALIVSLLGVFLMPIGA